MKPVKDTEEPEKSKIKIQNDEWSQLSSDSQKSKNSKILTNEGPLSITEIKTRFMHKRPSTQENTSSRMKNAF